MLSHTSAAVESCCELLLSIAQAIMIATSLKHKNKKNHHPKGNGFFYFNQMLIYLKSTNSTSKISVALGGIDGIRPWGP